MKMRPGQAMAEYVLMLCAMLVAFVAMGAVVAAACRNADRTNALVRSDYP